MVSEPLQTTAVFVTATQRDSASLSLQYAEIKEVRLVKNRVGRSKGFAYTEYCEEVGPVMTSY